jgi:hypothetical protein
MAGQLLALIAPLIRALMSTVVVLVLVLDSRGSLFMSLLANSPSFLVCLMPCLFSF